MRISDWSSDVCSSDLRRPWRAGALMAEAHRRRRERDAQRRGGFSGERPALRRGGAREADLRHAGERACRIEGGEAADGDRAPRIGGGGVPMATARATTRDAEGR